MQTNAKTFRHVAQGIFFLVFAGFILWFATRPTLLKDFNLQVTEQPYARVITVNGEGELSMRPDMAIVNLSVVERGSTVEDVTLAGNEKMGAVVAFLKGLGAGVADR